MTTRKHTTRATHPHPAPTTPANPTAQAFRDAAAAARKRAKDLEKRAESPPLADDASASRSFVADCMGWADDCAQHAQQLEEMAGLLDGSTLPDVPA